jgi:hypothetical protein
MAMENFYYCIYNIQYFVAEAKLYVKVLIQDK